MGADEHELEEVLRIKKRRLRELQKDLARLGQEAPPSLRTEEEDLRKEVEADKQVIEPIAKGELPADTLAALRAYGIPATVKNALQNLEARFYELKRDFQAYRDQQSRLREKESSERETRQQQTDQQREAVNTRLTRIEAIAALILVFVTVAIVIGIVALVKAWR